jgi:hypothetical protein
MTNRSYGDPVEREAGQAVRVREQNDEIQNRWKLSDDTLEEVDKIAEQQRSAEHRSGTLLLR